MRIVWAGALVIVGAARALAQDHHGAEHGPADLNPAQAEGRRLYQQSCGVCHTKPTITSPLFGPQLSKAVVDGARETQAKKQIAEGSPNMPGFKYMYTPTQIDAVVEFLKLIPAPPPASPRPAATPAPRNPAN